MTLVLQALVVKVAIHAGEKIYMYKTVILNLRGSGSGLVTRVNIIVVTYYVITSQFGRSRVLGMVVDIVVTQGYQ